MKAKLDHDRLLTFYCPGCHTWHKLDTQLWRWNGDVDAPSIRPSIRIATGHYADPQWPQDPTDSICHSMVVQGQIRYIGDSTHHLSGCTIDLPDIA